MVNAAMGKGWRRCPICDPDSEGVQYGSGKPRKLTRYASDRRSVWVLAGQINIGDVHCARYDYQERRAGGQHNEASSERGVLLLVHGDLELDVIDTEQH